MSIDIVSGIYGSSSIANAVIASYFTNLMHPVRSAKDTKIESRDLRTYKVNETERISDEMLGYYIGKFLDLKA